MPEALAALQSWLQAGIVAGAAESIDDRIEGDERLSARDRLAIHSGGYRSRLLESLRDEYPVLRRLVGDTVFGLFVTSYVAARPPRHFSLYDVGAGFADHLDATRPAEGGGPLAALPAALARLERARSEVTRAEGVERAERFQPQADAALLPGLRLRLPDSVRLLRLDFDLLPLVEASDRGGAAVVPGMRPSFVAVARSDYRVRLHDLAPWRLVWLETLGSDGADVQHAAVAAARASGRAPGEVIADLALWIPAAASLGLLLPGQGT